MPNREEFHSTLYDIMATSIFGAFYPGAGRCNWPRQDRTPDGREIVDVEYEDITDEVSSPGETPQIPTN